MSERITGASDEQIEAACAARTDVIWTSGERWEQVDEYRKRAARDNVLSYAEFLIPPTHRIVALSDLELVLSLVPKWLTPKKQAAIDRLRAAVTG